MARLNVRIRHRLFASLLRQEIGFFDSTKTGEITSRLSADTTTVADQICLNLNVMLRSITQAALVLVRLWLPPIPSVACAIALTLVIEFAIATIARHWATPSRLTSYL